MKESKKLQTHFDSLIKRASKPVKELRQKAGQSSDNYSDKQTRSHKL